MSTESLKKRWQALAARHNHHITTLSFRACLGLIYVIVFLSLLPQAQLLIGSTGLLPIEQATAQSQADVLAFPTLHWWLHSDFWIHALLVLGIIFAIALSLGLFPKTSLIACFLLYLSVVTSGRDFFSFQWDNLLLEASFLALFLPLQGVLLPSRIKAGLPKLVTGKPPHQPSSILIFLFSWLLFRLYFESGLAKLLHGKEDWLQLTALQYYYETAPLPSVGGWLFQQLPPDLLHLIAVFAVFSIELIIPFLLFWPRKARIASFYILTGFNLLIFLSSNYGFFNILAIIIGLFLLDDQHLRAIAGKTQRMMGIKKVIGKIDPVTRVMASKRSEKAKPDDKNRSLATDPVGKTETMSDRPLASSSLKTQTPLAPEKHHHYMALFLALFIIPFSIVEFFPIINTQPPESMQPIMEAYRPFHIINRYHLFPGIVKDRIVIEIQARTEDTAWQPYRLKLTPQDPTAMPPVLPFYQARFAFQQSFLPNGRLNSQYFQALLDKVCHSPSDIQPLFRDTLQENPQQLRLSFYRYAFSEPGQLLAEGIWWGREHLGDSEPMPC